MPAGAYDLHTHTTVSDGTLRPADSVAHAKEQNLSGLAITDHDTVNGVAEAVEAGKRLGIEIVPGVEISTSDGGEDIHVLGLWIDPVDELFRERLGSQREARFQRNHLLICRLQELSFDVNLDEAERIAMERRSGTGRAFGRPHIAELLVRKGYVGSIKEAFARYLGRDGEAYVSTPRIPPETAIQWIREAGGLAVLAHPGLYSTGKGEELVSRLPAYGLDGVEAAHADHGPEEEALYGGLAGIHGLIVTAGSDFHGFREGVPFHAPLGSRTVDEQVFQELRQRAEQRKRDIR